MTVPVNSDAARAPQAPAEAGQPDGSQLSRNTIVRERVLAALEAQLAHELHDSPSIAAEEGDDIPPHRDAGAPRPLRPIARREGPVARRVRPQETPLKPAEDLDGRRVEDLLRELRRLSAPESVSAREPEGMREPEMPRVTQFRHELRDARAPLSVPPWADRPSPVVRAMRVAAAIFSVVALVGASALVVALTMGSERPATQAAMVASALGRGADRAENDNASPVSPERDDAPVITGAIGSKREASRIPSEAAASARGDGMLRPAEAPTRGPFVAARPANLSARPRESGDPEPQSVGQVALDSRLRGNERIGSTNPGASAPREPEPVRFSAPPSIPAQVQTAAAETNSEGGRSEVDAARAMRNVAVTQHVNMRAEPKNEAAVVIVVPEGKKVEVVDCGQWCEVVYDGRKGFIHKRFVAGQ